MATTTRSQQHPSAQERDAARRYLEHSHAAGQLGGQARAEANRHAQEIDEQHPRARDIALTGTARELGELPKHLRAHQRNERARAGIGTDEAARIRREYRAGPYQEPDTPQPRPRPRIGEAGRRGAGLAAAGARQAADTSWGELFLDLFLGGMGLSIFYLLLTHDKAASKLVEGASNVVRVVVSPHIDPLNPKGA